MQAYSHILLAVDIPLENKAVAQRAAQLAGLSGARLSLLHVVEDTTTTQMAAQEPWLTPAATPLSPIARTLDQSLTQELAGKAKTQLQQLAADLELPEAQVIVRTGLSTKHEIHDAAEKNAVDLIVVGSHGRHGLALLLGSTSNAVLHGAPCDVLAVRI